MKSTFIQGFTLIELILYLGLTSILIALMSQVFLATLSVRLESQQTTSLQQDARYILARLAYDLRRSESVTTPQLGQTQSVIRLKINEKGVDQTYTYALNGTDVVLSVGTESAQLNGNGSRVMDFSVSRIGNSGSLATAKDTFQISLEFMGNTDITTGQQTLTVGSTVGLR